MEKVVIYARYSPGSRQTEQSIEGQVRDIEAFCKSKDYTIIGRYYDKAITGKTDKRPEFQRMLKDSSKQLFKYVVVWQLDRFARNKYESAVHKNTLKKNGVRVLSAKENITDDPAGIMLETMLEGMAEYFSAENRVKVLRGMNESFLKGYALGGTKCYGYDTVAVSQDPKNRSKQFVINEKEAEVIRKIFSEFAGGKIIKDIKKWLDGEGIMNKLGKPFLYNQVITILKNKKYIGIYTFAGQENKGVIPAIVDPNIFKLAQARIEKNKKKPASKKAFDQYVLTHKAYCGFCHKSLISDCGTGNKGIVYRYYKCTNKKKNIKPCCLKQIAKKYLEDLIVNAVNEAINDEFIILASKQVVAKSKQLAENIKLAEYENELAQVQKEIDNMLNAIAQGFFNTSMQEKMLNLESKKADFTSLIAEEKLNVPVPLVEDEVVFWFTQFQNGDLTDDSFRNRLIDMFVNKAVVFNDKILLTLNVRQSDKESLTVKEIIADFEKEKHQPEKFELVRLGAT